MRFQIPGKQNSASSQKKITQPKAKMKKEKEKNAKRNNIRFRFPQRHLSSFHLLRLFSRYENVNNQILKTKGKSFVV